MITATVKLKSVSPYSQSRFHGIEKTSDETHAAHRDRTWREQMHTDSNGMVIIPPMTFKNCLSEAAKFLGKKVSGKGNKTYTKYFESGIMVVDPAALNIKASEVEPEHLHLPSDGIRGSGKRVMKIYPKIPKWECDVTFLVLDGTIDRKVFLEHLVAAGKYVGIGRFRPSKNGYYGRFEAENLTWEEQN